MAKAKNKQLDLITPPAQSPTHLVRDNVLLLAYPRGTKVPLDDMPDFWTQTVHRLYPSLTSNWKWFHAERIVGGVLLIGAVPLGTVVRGNRKGRERWPAVKACQKIVVTDEQMHETKQRWAEQTHKCPKCSGRGLVTHGFDEQAHYERVCLDCKGTGRYYATRPLPPLEVS